MTSIRIGERLVDESQPPYCVAELSGNHQQSIEQAKALIDASVEAGADAVKLQTYTPDTITLPARTDLFRVEGGLWDGRYLHELYQEAMTPWEWHGELAAYARSKRVELFSTPFDETAVDYLEAEVQPPVYKIASFELNHLPLLRKVGALGKPVILSTGMASFQEIEVAVYTLRKAGAIGIALLKCVSAYPADPADFNLKALATLKEHFDCPVGLSDHSLGHEICHGAVALGCSLIEKHIVLDREAGGIDSGFSLEPHEFAEMVKSVKRLHAGMGNSELGASQQDEKQKRFRRSIFVADAIKQGDVLTHNNIKIVRPSDGLEPVHWEQLLGKKAKRDLDMGMPLTWDMVEN